MNSPIFRWSLVSSPNDCRDSEETFYEGTQEVNVDEPSTQQENDSQVLRGNDLATSYYNDTPSQSQVLLGNDLATPYPYNETPTQSQVLLGNDLATSYPYNETPTQSQALLGNDLATSYPYNETPTQSQALLGNDLATSYPYNETPTQSQVLLGNDLATSYPYNETPTQSQVLLGNDLATSYNETPTQSQALLGNALATSYPYNETPTQSQVSPNLLAREDLPKSVNSTPSYYDFGNPVAVTSRRDSVQVPDRRNGSQDSDSKWNMCVDSDDAVIPSSQPESPSNLHYGTGFIGKPCFELQSDANNSAPLVYEDKQGTSEVLTGISDFVEAQSFFGDANQPAQTSLEERSINRGSRVPSTAMSVQGKDDECARSLESLPIIPERGIDTNFQSSLEELIKDFPAEPVLSKEEIDGFLRVLDSPPHPSGDNSNPLTVAGLVSTFDQLRLSSTSEGNSIPFLPNSSPEEISESSKVLKRISSPPNPVYTKKMRMLEMKTPRSKGKSLKSKKQLTPCLTMTLRSKGIRVEETPARPVLRPEESPAASWIHKSDKTPSKTQEKSKRTTASQKGMKPYCGQDYCAPGCSNVRDKNVRPNAKSMKRKAPSSNWSGKSRRKKVPETSSKLPLEEPETIVSEPPRRRGRPTKTRGFYSEPLIDDYSGTDEEPPKSTPKHSERGDSQPITLSLGTSRRSRNSTSPGVNQVFAKVPSAERVNAVQKYLHSARSKLLSVIFEESTISKEECETIGQGIKEKKTELLQWSPSGIKDGKIRNKVEDLSALCETLRRQVEVLTCNASDTTPLEVDISDVPIDNFLVPGTPRSQHLSKPRKERTQMEVRLVAKKSKVRGTDEQDRKSNEKQRPSQDKTLGSNLMESPRVVKRVDRPPIIFASSLQREDSLTVHNTSPPSLRVGTEELRLTESTGRNSLRMCAHSCGCVPKSSKTFADQGTNTDLIKPPKPRGNKRKLIDSSTQTDVEELKKSRVLVDYGTNTEIYYSVDWNDSSEGDQRVPDSDDKENVDPKFDLRNITGIWCYREGAGAAGSSYDHVLSEIMSNPNFELPQEYLDDMRWDSD